MRTRRLFSYRWFVPRVWLTPASGLALCAAWLVAGGLCAAPALAQSGKPARELIAVLELEAVEASKSEAAALTDRLREELLRTGAVTLVDRGQLDAVLNEQALQQTGCTTQECAVQVGRILGVRKIVAGRVNKVSAQIWLVSASVIDVETAETLRSESKQFRGDFFDLMGVGMTQLAQQLLPPPVASARPAVPPAAPAAPRPAPAVQRKTPSERGTSGWAVTGLVLGGGLLLYAGAEYQSAVALNNDAKKLATTDPDKSKRFVSERNQKATYAAGAGVLGLIFVGAAIANWSSDSATAQAPGWEVWPVVMAPGGEPGAGVWIRYRW